MSGAARVVVDIGSTTTKAVMFRRTDRWELVRREEVFVGRVRVDGADPEVVRFWVVSDQLWKGAALNVIQIAEQLLALGRFDS